MQRRLDAHVARTQFGQIMDLAVKNDDRFVVARRGEPAVVIMSVQDFIRLDAPPSDWLLKAWGDSKRRGLDSLSLDDSNAEIDAERQQAEQIRVDDARRFGSLSIEISWFQSSSRPAKMRR